MSIADTPGLHWGTHPDGGETPLSVTNERVIATRDGYPVTVQDILNLAQEIRRTPGIDTNTEVLVRWGQRSYPRLIVVASA